MATSAPGGARGGMEPEAENLAIDNATANLDADAGSPMTLEELEASNIQEMAKDKFKSRLLQRSLLRGSPEVADLIYKKSQPYFMELVRDQYGNYLSQKILEAANSEQFGELFALLKPHLKDLAQDVHGTRAVQKVVEQAISRGKAEELLEALPGQLIEELARSVTGFHVIVKLLDALPAKEAPPPPSLPLSLASTAMAPAHSLGTVRCITDGCRFLAHSSAEFQGLCCRACQEGFHGRRCEGRPCPGEESQAEAPQRCSKGCSFLAHSSGKFQGMCCGACREGFHGRLCERRRWRPSAKAQTPGSAPRQPAIPAAAAVSTSPPSVSAKPGRVWEVLGTLRVRDGSDASSKKRACLEPGALLAELALEHGRLRFTLLAGEGPSDGWLDLPPPGDDPLLVAAGGPGSRAAREAAGKAAAPAAKSGGKAAQKVWIMVYGSRGDLQPCVALGVGLRNAGFQVRIFAAACHQSLVESYGLLFSDCGIDLKTAFAKIMSSPEYRSADPSDIVQLVLEQLGEHLGAATWRNPTKILVGMLKQEVPDLLLVHGELRMLGLLAWRRNRVPICQFDYCPYHMKFSQEQIDHWKDNEAKVVADETKINPLGGCYPEKLQSWWAEHRVVMCCPSAAEGFGEGFGLEEEEGRKAVQRQCKGFVVLDQTQQMVDFADFGGAETLCKVQAYLDAGKKPVYLGWGSMPVPVCVLVKFIMTFKVSSLRAIVSAGWGMSTLEAVKEYVEKHYPGDPDQLVKFAEEELLFIGAVSHEWLFPRCACTIHHGGAGTTCATVRAGVPTIVTPSFAVDQPGWGHWVSSIGVGLKLDLFEDWDLLEDPVWVAAVAKAVSDREMAFKARQWGRKLRREEGTEAMVDHVRRLISLSGADASRVDDDGIPRFAW